MSDPHVVRIPLVATRSLIDTGTPKSGGSVTAFRPSMRVARRAAASADSRAKVTYAFTVGFTTSMRAKTACMTSSGEALRARKRRTSSLAEMKQMSRLSLMGVHHHDDSHVASSPKPVEADF